MPIPLPPYQGPPPDDGSQDELQQIGQCLCSGLNWIIAFIQQVTQQPQSDCCNQIVASLTAINSSLISVFDQLAHPAPEPPPPDFSGIIAELQCLCTAAQQYPAFVRDMVTYLGAQLAAVAKTIVPPVDFTPIVNELKIANSRTDIPESILAVLREKLNLPPEFNALLQGMPDWLLEVILEVLGWVVPIGPIGGLIGPSPTPSSPSLDRIEMWIKKILAELINELPKFLHEVGASIIAILKGAVGDFIKVDDQVFWPIIKDLIADIETLLKPAGGAATSLGNISVDPDKVIEKGASVALGASLMAWLASFSGIDGGPPLKDMAEKIAGLIGFDELRDVVIKPLVQHGIKAVADMQARSLFAQHVPKGADVAVWMARGLVDPGFGRRLMRLDGFGNEVTQATLDTAYRGINPRMFLQMIQTGLFTEADLRDELTNNGIRPTTQNRLMLAAPYITTAPYRSTARTALENAYVGGLLDDSEFTQQLDSLEHNTDRDSLLLLDVKWRKLLAITKDLEAQYATLYEGGLIDDATLHDHLSAIGLQDDVANAVAARSEARANAALQRRTLADARALAKATAAQERRAATRSFVAGQIDLAALAAALVATGLTPVQAAAWSEIAQLQKTGLPVWVYGLRLPREQATNLRSRVTALLDQRKRQLLTGQEFHDALTSLGIPSEWINSLRATAEAMITPKAAATLVPVELNKP